MWLIHPSSGIPVKFNLRNFYTMSVTEFWVLRKANLIVFAVWFLSIPEFTVIPLAPEI